MSLLILDNYDSFTFNLVHLVEKCSEIPFVVKRNDEISPKEASQFKKILLSPGPGLPSEAGMMPSIIKNSHATSSILGVCLGLQAIGEFFGASLTNLPRVFHGLATRIKILKSDPLFENCPQQFNVGRYHSWVVERNSLPADLMVIAEDEEGLVMAARHKNFDIAGVQFHPESILSEHGETIIRNWLKS